MEGLLGLFGEGAGPVKLSVVITTRNEADNIANCIHAFDAFRDDVEIVVVDNRSEDATKQIAASLGARVFDKGPERSAQRNLGWKTASAEWVVVLDADMILPRETIEEILSIAEPGEDLGRTAKDAASSLPSNVSSPNEIKK